MAQCFKSICDTIVGMKIQISAPTEEARECTCMPLTPAVRREDTGGLLGHVGFQPS